MTMLPPPEPFIPVRVPDLVDVLVAGRGCRVPQPPLPESDQAAFRRLTQSLIRYFHRTFNSRFQRLKDAYADFDPDRDTLDLEEHNPEEKRQAELQLFAEVSSVLARANYRELTRDEAMRIMQGASPWGLELDVDWQVFERIIIGYRGDSLGKRTLRRWWKLWKKEERLVPEFRRLIIVLKQAPHRRLGKNADTRSIFLKMFKEVPKCDLEMVLPGTRIRLSKLDHGLIFYPIISGIALIVYKILSDWIGFRDVLAIGASVSLSWSLAGLFAGYGWRSYVRYTFKKTTYNLRLTQSLYYQAVDSNAGVFFRLLDEAEEQEVCESLLAYFELWRAGSAGLTEREIKHAIETDLQRRLDLTIDFDVHDAVGKLKALGLAVVEGERYRAIPLSAAIAAIDAAA